MHELWSQTALVKLRWQTYACFPDSWFYHTMVCVHRILLDLGKSGHSVTPKWNLISVIYCLSEWESSHLIPQISFKNYLNVHHVPGTVSENSSCFSDHFDISSPISHNRAKAALGLPCAWPSRCSPSLRDDVRGSLAAWGMELGKSPGVFRHCFRPKKQNTHKTAKGPSLLREHVVLPCLQHHFLDKQQLWLLDFWPCAVTARQGTSHTNEPVKWGNCGFLWMLFLSPRQCWRGYEEQERCICHTMALCTKWG